jgi:hypothetical protein
VFSSAVDHDVTISDDGLTLIAWRNRQFASAHRESSDHMFGAPVPDPLLKTASDWFIQSQEALYDVPSLSGDGLAIYGDFGGQAVYQAFVARRSFATEEFGVGARVPGLDDVYLRSPAISADGQVLYIVQGSHLFYTRLSGDAFGPIVAIGATDSPAGERSPVISHDQLTLYFASERTDGTAKGMSDIWVSTRSDSAADFGFPHAIDELNSPDDDVPVWISPDACEMFILRGSHLAVSRRPL